MTSKALLPSGSQVPRVHVAPRTDSTFGDLAAKFAADYGLAPDEWQRLVLDDWLGSQGDRWASLTCGLAVARQNGKNALLEVRELFGAVGLGEKILHTAHEVKTAQKHFRRLKYFFGQSKDDPGALFPELNALVVNVRSVNGQEGIFLTNGGSIELVARSKNSGRGFTVDVLVMDEAQELSEDALEALMPTTSAAPLKNPQWIFTGTPPGPNADGAVFTRIRDEAHGKKSTRLSWHEWSAVPGADLDDRSVWRLTNPALDTGRLQLDVIEGERARFSDDGFARERLGVWPEPDSGTGVVDMVKWNGHTGPLVPPVGHVVLSVDTSLDRQVSAVVAVGAGADLVPQVRVVRSAAGTGWVAGLVAQVCTERTEVSTVVVDDRGSAAPLIPAIQDAIDEAQLNVRVLTTNYSDIAEACAITFDLIHEGQLRHAGDVELDAAVRSAEKRESEGAFVWSRRKGGSAVVPLIAMSLALWAFTSMSELDPAMNVW